TVSEYRSRQIGAIGAVNSPGVYAIRENVVTLTDFLSLAGGPATDAASVAYILRPAPDGSEPLKITVDLDELFKTRRTELDAVLLAGDVVYVPVAPFVYVYGAVLQPGAIGLKKPTTFLEAIALAGGFEREADSERVRLKRKTRGVREESIYVNVNKIETGTKLDPYLHEGDIIIVSESPSKNFAHGLWEIFRSVLSVSYRLDTNSP
ncbi:MAG: protein involved in polysaccharide export with SLBB domain, partial [Candidatus Omnitrophota bacterium]